MPNHPDRSTNDPASSAGSSVPGPGGPRRRQTDWAPEGANQGASPAAGERAGEYHGPDRRKADAAAYTGLERRRGPGRRLSDFTKAAEEGELTKEQFLFLMAIEAFKRSNGKTYPAWTDVLEVIRLLGYRKVQASALTLRNADDFTEAADAPANVRPKGFDRRAVA